MDVAFDAARNHQLFAVVAFCVAQERRDKQRLALHQAVHVSFLEMKVGERRLQASAFRQLA